MVTLVATGIEERRFTIPQDLIWRLAYGSRYVESDIERIVHRDLAARNVLLDAGLEPLISDFGFSRVVRGDEKQGQTNSAIGSIRWMAPESIGASTYSEKSDVWSYASKLYEVASRLRAKIF